MIFLDVNRRDEVLFAFFTFPVFRILTSLDDLKFASRRN
jgi:hypothetical protein